MGKTYRKVPEANLLESEKQSKKIKKIDKKHGEVITSDGFYSHPINDGKEMTMDDTVIRFEGVVNPKDKKIAKRAAAKRARRKKIELED